MRKVVFFGAALIFATANIGVFASFQLLNASAHGAIGDRDSRLVDQGRFPVGHGEALRISTHRSIASERSTYVGPLVALSITSGRLIEGFPRIGPRYDADNPSSVNAIVSDGAGGWWVAGLFRYIDGRSCPTLAHITARLHIDPRSCLRLRDSYGGAGSVDALARDGRTLFAGGGFVSINGHRRASLAAFDALDGRLLPWHPTTRWGSESAYITSIAPQGAIVYVAGDFDRLNGARRFTVGALDANSGRTTAWRPRPEPNQHGEAVDSVVPAGNKIFLEGVFSP